MCIYDIDVVTIDGKAQKMGAYRGEDAAHRQRCERVWLHAAVRGTANALRQIQRQGFVVLGFPCNQFGQQEPSGEVEIEQFCTKSYGVTFPMFAKIEVNGENAHPLYKYLKSEKPGIFGTEAIKWNFTRFPVGSDGTVLKRYAPNHKPEAIEGDVTARL